MRKIENWQKESKKIAERATFRHKLGAVVIQRNKVVGTGHCIVPQNGLIHEGICAERKAIKNTLARNRIGSEIYVCRINRRGDYLLSKPCVICQMVLKKVGVSRVFYSIDNSRWGKMEL
jgi:cytidine deaminase